MFRKYIYASRNIITVNGGDYHFEVIAINLFNIIISSSLYYENISVQFYILYFIRNLKFLRSAHRHRHCA